MSEISTPGLRKADTEVFDASFWTEKSWNLILGHIPGELPAAHTGGWITAELLSHYTLQQKSCSALGLRPARM